MTDDTKTAAVVHASAQVEADVSIGDGTQVWSGVHVRRGARIGADCRIGGNAFIDIDVRIGDRCKILNNALVFHGAVIEDEVFIGPAACLTNDRRPRAASPDGTALTDADWTLSGITIERGASVGAGAVVVAGVRLGAWSMAGAGAVVTTDVAPQSLVVGTPARHIAWLCKCGSRLSAEHDCPTCGRRYAITDGHVLPA